MPKTRITFACQQCGAESPKWSGRCPNCQEWNTLVETVLTASHSGSFLERGQKIIPQKLSEIKFVNNQRVKTGIQEFDRVLGGGIVSGSLVLVAGEPGIGKSTLLLQLAHLATKDSNSGKDKKLPIKFLYVSGEESPQQIKIRTERLKIKNDNILFLPETNVENIIDAVKELKKENQQVLIVVDSIQTLTTDEFNGSAGSIGQVRESTSRLLKMAKSTGFPVFLVGHVTKEGSVAGPKTLEHMVDTVLYLEGEKFGTFRLLRTTKNRFGATDEVGVFEMVQTGMLEVNNPSRLFLSERQKGVPGSIVVATMEGTRPVLVEIQALVVPTQLAIPRRLASGVDFNRLQLIVAVLSKRLNLPLGAFDIFVNVVGGIKIEEPAADLGIALAIFSSFKNLLIDNKTAVFGELGLLGEIRQVPHTILRKKEAKRLGFTKIISPEKYTSITQLRKL